MIKISYTNSYTNNDNREEGNCELRFNDECTLVEVLYGFIKVCEFAGYSAGSFDNILDEYDKEESFKDYCMDCLDALYY